MLNFFKDAASAALKDALCRTENLRETTLSFERLWTIPPSFAQGQLALPCFLWAKELKKSPQQIATDLAAAINAAVSANSPVARAESSGGYLNFHMNFSLCAKNLYSLILSGDYFQIKPISAENREKINVEYSQPNTHKALHVGHLRCLVLGDAVARVLAAAGHNVIKATYPGDLGAHVAKVLWYIKKYNLSPTGSAAHWLGTQYADADAALKNLAEPEAALAKNEITAVLQELQQKSGAFYDLYLTTREWSLDFMRQTYKWLGVTFDQWYFESSCDEPSRQLVNDYLEKGLFVKDNGAIGIDLSDHKLGFALLLKSDGNGLYLTKDLELIRQKFADPHVTRSIAVVDARQKLHFQQVFKIAELMGYKGAAKSFHVAYETVNTPDGKPFSSREKKGTDLWELKELMEAEIKTRYLNQYANDWDSAEITHTAEMIAVGALKYGMLRVDSQTKIHFHLDEWLRLDGDTGPYLQYVCARCSTLLAKLGFNSKVTIPENILLPQTEEQEVMVHLYRFWDVVHAAAEGYKPHLLANYLFDLCKLFNGFYENCSVRNAAEELKLSRIALIAATAQVLRYGLGVLGIPAPQRM